jgi:hypothetical protein
MKVNETHTWWGEFFGTICWLWVFHRFRHDGPVLLGFRHPWEHADDGHHHSDHTVHDDGTLYSKIDKFNAKAIIQNESDGDDDEEEGNEDGNDGDDDDEE